MNIEVIINLDKEDMVLFHRILEYGESCVSVEETNNGIAGKIENLCGRIRKNILEAILDADEL